MKQVYLTFLFNIIYILSSNAQAVFFKNLDDSNLTNLTISPGIEFNNYRYFSSSKSTSSGVSSGSTIWKTDGTSANTIDFINDENITSATPIFVFNNELYYNVSTFPTFETKVYKTDGITKTLFLEKNTAAPFVFLESTAIASINNNLIFKHTTVATGEELYISDGTPNNPILLKDIRPGSSGSSLNSFTEIANNKVVFRANDGINGTELWVTDGTENGTQMVKDITPDQGNSFFIKLTSFKGKAYFYLNNALWETDGTEAGTKIFLNLSLDDTSNTPIYEYNDALYFTVENSITHKTELWKSDGTVSGSEVLTTNLNFADKFQKTNNLLFFAAEDDEHGYELWRTDGTPNGTFLTKDIVDGTEGGLSRFNSFGNGGDLLYFNAIFNSDNENVKNNLDGELWSSDGTNTGTILNTTLNPTSGSGNPDSFFNINDKLIFKADATQFGVGNQRRGVNLWTVDANILSTTENDFTTNDFTLYPNPVKNNIYLKKHQNLNIKNMRIYTINGQEIMNITVPKEEIKVDHLSSGIYLLQINTDNYYKVLKFVKQ